MKIASSIALVTLALAGVHAAPIENDGNSGSLAVQWAMRKHFVDGTLQECSRHSHRVGSFFGSWRAPSPRAETISPLVVGRGREHIDFGDDVVDDDDEESSATDDDEVSSATDDDDVSSATDDEEEEDEESVETETRCSILLLGKKLHEMNEAINTPSVLALIHNRTPQWLIKPKVETSDPSECQFTYNPPQRIEPGSIAPVAVQSFKSPSFFSKHDPRKYLGCTFLISYKVEVESKSKRYINTFVDFTDRNNVRHATLVSTGERLMLAAAEFRPRSATNFRPLVTFEGKGDTRFRGSMYEDTQAVAGLTVEQFLSELSGPNQSSHYRLGVAVNGEASKGFHLHSGSEMLARAKMCSKNIDDVQSMARETAAHCERLISNAAILREHLREMDEEEERGMSVL